MLPEKVRLLHVRVGPSTVGQLTHDSRYVFAYSSDDRGQPPVGLLMPPNPLVYEDTALFAVMDQNLPEGYLFNRIRERFPKQNLTPMHLLALAGDNGIGRLGYRLPDAPEPAAPVPISRADLLNSSAEPDLFEKLVSAYLSTGLGVSGLQPKIMVPDRATIPVPNLIIKAGSSSYPGISANEFVCLSAARKAEISVPNFELSANGELLILERFDLGEDGTRLGFEDVASLMGLRVRDVLSDRKYHGSYQAVAELLQFLSLEHASLERFFEQLCFSVLVRNGDAHLKNFGLLLRTQNDAQLAPMFDVVTTSIYRYSRFDGGPPMEDHTMALKLRRGKHANRGYPAAHELLEFGRDVCGVKRPAETIERISEAMSATLAEVRGDDRIKAELIAQMQDAWEHGFALARESASQSKAKAKRRVRAHHQG